MITAVPLARSAGGRKTRSSGLSMRRIRPRASGCSSLWVLNPSSLEAIAPTSGLAERNHGVLFDGSCSAAEHPTRSGRPYFSSRYHRRSPDPSVTSRNSSQNGTNGDGTELRSTATLRSRSSHRRDLLKWKVLEEA